MSRPGRARSAAVALVVAVGCLFALPATSGASVAVTSTSNTLEVKLDSGVSDIAISGPSDESVTLSEQSGSGPTFATSASGGSSCQGDGTRLVTCKASVAYVSILVVDDLAASPRDTVNASASPVLVSSGGAGGTLTSPISIKASPFNDFLHGSSGADEIKGEEGHDEIFGLAGNDTIDSHDGYSDRVNCGDDFDTVKADAADELVNCERPIVVVDADADGYFVPEDCNDSDPAINPGAKEVPGNGVDEDCDGKDDSYPDADADGFAKTTDCDDSDPKVNPAAKEILGNAVDENCDGTSAPFPAIGSSVLSSFQVSGPRTRVAQLVVTDVPQGASIRLTCKSGGHGGGGGGGCAFSKESFGFPRGPRQTVDLSSSFKRRKLLAGTVITVQITSPQTIGKSVQFTTRKAKAPISTVGCVQPEGKVVHPCGAFNQPSGVR